jgi:hypothetical protein
MMLHNGFRLSQLSPKVLVFHDHQWCSGTISIAAVDTSATNELQNVFTTFSSQSGSTTANIQTDTLTINGSGIASTAVSGDTLTVTATEADTLASVTGRGATTTTLVNFNGGITSTGAIIGKALTRLNETGDQAIFTASASGTTRFTLGNNGDIAQITANGTDLFNLLTGSMKIGNASPTLTLNGEDLYVEGTLEADGAVRFDNSSITLGDSSFANCATLGTSSNAITCGSTAPSNYWQLNSNVLAPGGSASVTDRLTLGGNTSTPFQFEVNGAQTGKALVSLNETGDQDIFTASASGSTKFIVDRNGTIALGGTSVDRLFNKYIDLDLNISPSDNTYGNYIGLVSDTNVNLYGQSITVDSNAGSNLTNILYGTEINAIGDNPTSDLEGLVVRATQRQGDSDYVNGIYGSATTGSNSLTIDEANGINGSVSANQNGTITDASIFRAFGSVATGGTITSLKGLNLSGWSNSGTIGTSYGIYMDNSIDVGAVKYALYSSSNSDSYFAGKLGIGTSTPDGKLDLNGTVPGKALTILNDTGTDQNILTASASGTTVANLDRSGNLTIEGSIADLSGATLQVNDNLDVNGTTGLTLSGSGADLIFANSERITNDTNGQFNFGRNDAGTVTLTANDDDATAALTILPGGAAALTLGGSSTTQTTFTTDNNAANDFDFTGGATFNNALAVNGNTTIGNANTDTLTINVGTSGTGITLADTTFANCTLTTVSNVLTCGATGGTMSSFTLTGSDSGTNQTITNGETLTIAAGTGIDTTPSNADTLTVALDTTELNDLTFGDNSDASIVWTVDPTGATNPSIAFANDAITLTAATTTLSGTTLTASSLATFTTAATLSMAATTTLNCGNCINFDDMKDAMTLDASTSIGFGAGSLDLTFTNDGSGNEIHNLSSTGDIVIQDNGTPFATFDDTGGITFAPNGTSDLTFTGDADSTAEFNLANTSQVNINTTLSAGNRTADVFSIIQASGANSNTTGNLIQLTNNDANSTAALLAIDQNATTGGALGISIDVTGGSTFTGGIGISANGATDDIQISSAHSLTSGTAIEVGRGESTSTSLSAFTGDIILAQIDREHTGATTITDTGNYLDLQRINRVNNASGTYNITGDLATLSSTLTKTAGTMIDTSNILSLAQNCGTGATCSGAVLDITNAGTGQGMLLTSSSTGDLMELDASGSGTTANGLLIQQTSSGTITDGIQIGSGSQLITNGINLASTGITTDISFQNGETLDNDTNSLFTFATNTSNADKFIIAPNVTASAGTFSGTLTSADLTANRTWTLPDADGTICVSGQACSLTGTVTSSGSSLAGKIAYFTSNSDITGDAGFQWTTATQNLNVSAGNIGKALAIFNSTSTDQNILTASGSGTTYLTLSNTGNLSTGDLTLGLNDASATITTQDTNEDLTIDPNGSGNITLTAGTLTASATTLTASSLATFTTAATLGMAATTTLNCADCIDFDDMKDAMTVDAATSIDAGSANDLTLTSTLSGGARSTYPLTISQANDAGNNNSVGLLSLSNSDTGSLAALLNITQVAGGSGINFPTTISGTSGSPAGILMSVGNGASASSATGISIASIANSGTGIKISTISTGTTGIDLRQGTLGDQKLLNIGATQTGINTGVGFTGYFLNIQPTLTFTASATNSTGNYLNVSRSQTASGGSTTLTENSNLVSFVSTCAVASGGTCTDTGKVLNLAQNYASASGNVLDITNAGTGIGVKLTTSSTGDLMELDASGAGTTANGLLIQQTGAGTLTDAIDVSDETITNAINLGANTITGAGYLVTSTGSGLTINSTSADLTLQTTTSGNISIIPAGVGDINITTDSDSFLNIAGLAGGTASSGLCVDSSNNVITCTTPSTNYWTKNTTTLTPATLSNRLLLTDGLTTDTSNFRLEVNGKETGKALAVFNETGDQNIFVASSSGTSLFQIAHNGTTAAPSVNYLTLNPTVPIMDGSDTIRGLNINLTNADHTGSNNILYGIDIQNIVNDSQASQIGINIGSGWNTGVLIAGSSNSTGVQITNAFSSGTGIFMNGLGALTTGKAISLIGTASNAAFSGKLIEAVITRTATTDVTESGNYLFLDRSANAINGSGKTLTVTGDVARLISNCTQTVGTCTDSGNILELDQQYANASGSVLNLLNAGTGQGIKLTSSSTGDLAELDASGAGTTANGLLIQQTGAGTLTDAIDVSDETITNAINLGANTITGAGYLVTSTGSGLTINSTSADLTLQTTTSGNINLAPKGSSTANVQIGTGGAGTSTPDFLALDVKSDTGDPAGGAEGYIYYNTFDNVFRCYQNSAWTNCIGAGGSYSFTAAGDTGGGQLISDTNTLSILGGTNGIDTVDSATDTVTLNLDTTEIGTTTFGSGSDFTWTFNGSGSTDPTIAFGNNSITTSGLTTLTRTLGADSGTTQNVGSVTFSSPADTTGTNVNQGLNITPTIGNATGGTNTANIFNIGAVSGDAEVTLNAIKIGTLTATGATETAINIGSNWDSALTIAGTSVFNATGILQSAALSGTYSNALTLSSTSNVLTGTIGQSTPLAGSFTTLSSTGATTLGNNSSTVAIDTTSWDVSSAGAISGLTGFTQASGAFAATLTTTNSALFSSSTTNADSIAIKPQSGTATNSFPVR